MALPKLNLRDFFWLAVVVAMGVAWWLDRQSNGYDNVQDFGSAGEILRLESELERCKKLLEETEAARSRDE